MINASKCVRSNKVSSYLLYFLLIVFKMEKKNLNKKTYFVTSGTSGLKQFGMMSATINFGITVVKKINQINE